LVFQENKDNIVVIPTQVNKFCQTKASEKTKELEFGKILL